MVQSTSEYYKKNTSARKRRVKQQARYNRGSLQIAKRVELNRENRKRGTYGNGDKLDVSHKRGGGTKLESQSSNRRRNRGLA
tara:strand:+ start:81 stop:326 length:246 start_codon:yes stop_codon:yes gene_type:complete